MTLTQARHTVCDRCGRERPADPNKHTIAFHHPGEDDRIFVCGDCWHRLKELSREVSR